MQQHLQESFGKRIPIHDQAAIDEEREVFFMLDVMGGAMIAEANRQHVPMAVPIDPKMFDDRSLMQRREDAIAACVAGKPVLAIPEASTANG